MTKIVVDPVTRVEGHLRVETEVDSGRVVDARVAGEMFRGFEAVLQGRDVLDAPVITQRICGVCPVSHAVASCRAVEDAQGLTPPPNGRLLRSLVLGANYLQSHLLHFYHLAALDFVDVTAVLAYDGPRADLRALRAWVEQEVSSNRILPAAPFLPRLQGDYPKDAAWNAAALAHYLDALEMRTEAHRMAARFGGKMPHTASLVPGGVTARVEHEDIEAFRAGLVRVRSFVENAYLPDLAALVARFGAYATVGRGVGRFLSYGAFEEADGSAWLPAGVVREGRFEPFDPARIAEQTGAARYARGTPRHPARGETRPEPGRAGAYSWIKAPRYDGEAVEVGPLARMMVARAAGVPDVTRAVDEALGRTGLGEQQLDSVAGRHLARGVETLLLARHMETWLDALEPGQPSVAPYDGDPSGAGYGLTEAPRGALGHWVTVADGRIERYQCLVPSTWNFSPRGDRGDPGPVEAAVLGTPVAADTRGLEVARVVRSFDPCIACAVH